MEPDILVKQGKPFIELEAPGRVKVEYGPVSMRIRAEDGGAGHTQAALKGADEVGRIIDSLAIHVHIARQPITTIRSDLSYPEVLNRMIIASKATYDPTVTPLAAVAGTVSELVAQVTRAAGASTVIVDNGGDIAAFVEPGRTVKVGVALDVETKKVSHYIPVEASSNIIGICTSGLGGRSVTKGVATAAVAIGIRPSVADACATLIGNATLVDDPAVKQELAEQSDPLTDIPGHLITTEVGWLSEDAVEMALEQGIEKGREFIERGLLSGVVVVVQGRMKVFPEGIVKLRKLAPGGVKDGK